MNIYRSDSQADISTQRRKACMHAVWVLFKDRHAGSYIFQTLRVRDSERETDSVCACVL